MSKELRVVITGLQGQGATVKVTHKGYQVLCPSGGIVTFHKTPSDHRAMGNLRSLIRRNGLTWPLD